MTAPIRTPTVRLAISRTSKVVRLLVGAPDDRFQLFTFFRKRIDFAVQCLTLHEDEPHRKVYQALGAYIDKFAKPPASWQVLKDYHLYLDADLHRRFGTAIDGEIEECKAADAHGILAEHLPDLEVLMVSMIQEGRVAYQVAALKDAVSVTMASTPYDPVKRSFGGKVGETGISAGIMLLRHRAEDDLNAPVSNILQGGWADNIAATELKLWNGLNPANRSRIFTGFAPIDEAMGIGPGEDIRFIGLLGFTNHGKSALLLPLIYNLAMSGVNVLFVPLEFSVEQTWERLTFMHAQHFPELDLCSLNTWKNSPHLVTAENRTSFLHVTADLKRGTTIPGRIDVIAATTWEEIVEYAEAKKGSVNYSVVALDYMANLEVSGRDKREATNDLFRQGQSMARNWDGGRGMVVITPLQANKEGKAAAAAREGAQWGSYEGLTGAVDTYTSATRDMDAIWGVWSEEALAGQGLIKVSCVKSRTRFFSPFLVAIDPTTRYARLSNRNMLEAQTFIEEPTMKRLTRGRRGLEPYDLGITSSDVITIDAYRAPATEREF